MINKAGFDDVKQSNTGTFQSFTKYFTNAYLLADSGRDIPEEAWLVASTALGTMLQSSKMPVVPAVPPTCSISRFPVRSHSLVCSKNNSYFEGIKPLIE